MKKDALLKTNLFICVIIVLGFAVASYVSYHSNNGIFKKDVEHISALTSEGIYYQIDAIFTKPINISLTMANDHLLKEFLNEEAARGDEDDFVQTMQNYLYGYKDKYGYDSVFLVSSQTSRYYHFNGIDRTLAPGNPENDWYYSFLNGREDTGLNIDNDEAAQNEVTVFINCKIKGDDGSVLGVVGVGFKVDSLQGIFRDYENQFGIKAYLIDADGTIQISTDQTGFEPSSLFDIDGCAVFEDKAFPSPEAENAFWYRQDGHEGYAVARYVPNLKWYLMIDNDTTVWRNQTIVQLSVGVLVIALVTATVLFVITRVIKRYNAQIVGLTLEREKKHNAVFKEETEKIYENIYEIDITHNRAASAATHQYFESLGVPEDTAAYDDALAIIAEKQIKEEYREGYLSTFGPRQVLRDYELGIENLRYEFMITKDGQHYYWMRITARIFFWEEDQSVRMFVYRQNIDEEKKREQYMSEKMKRDSLTGLYHKVGTQEQIDRALAAQPEKTYAFFILDIDDFKDVNDTCGHAMGDLVISRFASVLKAQFREDDIVGRIGGDEFAAFVPVPSPEYARQKAESLVAALHISYKGGRQITASVGASLAPRDGRDFAALYQKADSALYDVKAQGKDGFKLYESATSRSEKA
ncbi:MAG: GGDEF domain-containing protein [Eubacterium limosum]|nr:GGDEF domain-containing protein [Eubacterium limosum]